MEPFGNKGEQKRQASKFGRDYAFGKLCLFREYFGYDWKSMGDLCLPI